MSNLPDGVCKTTKRRYSSKAQAKQASKKLRRGRATLPGGNVRLYPYECPFCGDWHLTKQKSHTTERPPIRQPYTDY